MSTALKASRQASTSESPRIKAGDSDLLEPRDSFALERDDWGALVLVDEEGVRHWPIEPGRGFVLRELAPGLTREEVQAVTGAPLHADGDIPIIQVS